MPPVDMSSAAISRRVIRGSQLRRLGVGLAGPRRRPWTSLGTFERVGPDGLTPVAEGDASEVQPADRTLPADPEARTRTT